MTFRLRYVCAGALAFILPLAIYVCSLRIGVDFWDVGELQTVPFILGIPHPTGFPAYVMLGWVWSHLIPFGDPATRMNLFSAVAMAAAAAALATALMEIAVAPTIACGAALVFASTQIPWKHAVQADVHPLALAAVSVAAWAGLRWQRKGSPRMFVGGSICAAFALAVHTGTILTIPGITLAALSRRPSLALVARCVGVGTLLLLGFYAYLPLRSAVVWKQRLDPTLRLGIPPGRPFWDYDHPSTWAGFEAEVGGGDFGAAQSLTQLAQVTVWRQLPQKYGRETLNEFTGGVLLIALCGFVAVVRRAPLIGVGIGFGSLLPVIFVIAYSAESDPERYFLTSYWALAFFFGIGTDVLACGGLVSAPRSIGAIMIALFAYVVGANMYQNRDMFSNRANMDAQAFIARVVRETPSRSIVIASWNEATALGYAAYVEHRLAERIVVTGWTDDYLARYSGWIKERPIIFVSDEPMLQVTGLLVRKIGTTSAPAPYLYRARKVVR